MTRFTTRETILLNEYDDSTKQALLASIIAELPEMDADTRKIARSVIKKVKALSEEEFAEHVGCYAY